jgi:putative spermidine/putrescine transport system permease protein
MSLSLLARSLLGAVVFAVCAYLVLPTLIVVPISFTQTDYIAFPPRGFSLQWYETFLGEGPWRSSTLNSLLIATTSATLATVIGTLAALGLRKLPKSLARLAIWVVLLPMVVPAIIIAVSLYGVFASLGLIGTKLGLVLAHALLTLPFVVINVSAVMQKMDWRMVDAARSLGASPVTAFRKATLPAILPGVVAGFVFAFLTSFDEIVVALFISGIDSVTLPVQMWNGIRFEISPAVAAASSMLLLLSVFALAAYGAARRVGRPTPEGTPA